MNNLSCAFPSADVLPKPFPQKTPDQILPEEPPFGCFSPTFAHIPPEGTNPTKTPLCIPKFPLFAIPREDLAPPALPDGIDSQLQGAHPDFKEL